MFGQRNNNDENTGAPAVPPVGTLNTSTGIPDDQAVTQMLADTDSSSLSGAPMPVPAPAPSNSFMPFSGEAITPGPALVNGSLSTPVVSPAIAVPTPDPSPSPSPSKTTDMMDMSAEDLIRMKQEALQHLQPLVGTLQQNPEEEFRTLMMMIQATDDRSMLKKALEAAKKISDDKIRAQAMLDVINEINYFTQMSGDQN